ncbi:MAG TPA: MarR family transcriptional regulator [Pseudoxanthomonas sp.]|nr:MarR family transcriptional regulator [Pseudoxanthomonas sp.]
MQYKLPPPPSTSIPKPSLARDPSERPGLPLPPAVPAMGGSGREIGFLLKRIHHLVNGAIESRMRAHGLGLTFPRAVAMVSLLEDGGLSNAELARHAMVSPQTMHQILLRLEHDGLVARTADPDHGRVQRTALTEAGRALLMRGVAVSDPVFERLLHGLDADEQAQFARLLGHCVGNLVRAQDAESSAPGNRRKRGRGSPPRQ